MPPSLTYSTTASSSYTVGGTATGGTVNWTAHQGWDPLVYHYNIPDTATAAYRWIDHAEFDRAMDSIPDDPLGAETAAYGWSNAAALERAMEILKRDLRKEPDQNKIEELL